MADEVLKRDQNTTTVLGGITDDANEFVTMLRVDPTTKRLLVSASGSGIGTVTSVSVVSANGFAGTVATATTTPAITLTTTITGILQGNGTAISAITVGTGLSFVAGTLSATATDNITIGTTTITSGTTTRILYNNAGVVGEYTLTGTGTVVAMQTAPSFLTSITTPSVLASANDSGAIGASGTAFSDLFLASGAVINWLAGAVTITHSANTLTIAGSAYTTLALGATDITMTGSLAATGARVTKGWFTDIESTNMPTVGGTAILSSLTAPNFTTLDSMTSAASLPWTGMADGTDGQIPTFDSAGAPAFVATGNSGEVLTSNGAGAAPTFQAAAGGGASTKMLLPQPNQPVTGGFVEITTAVNTTAYFAMYSIPYSMTVTELGLRVSGTTGTDGTMDIALYAEDGQTRLFLITTDTIGDAAQTEFTAVSSVAVAAGQYYIGFVVNSTASLQLNAYTIPNVSFANGGEVTVGTLTVTAETMPATFDPTALTFSNAAGPLVVSLKGT